MKNDHPLQMMFEAHWRHQHPGVRPSKVNTDDDWTDFPGLILKHTATEGGAPPSDSNAGRNSKGTGGESPRK